jgi:RHS repeat-associated protein
MGQAVDYTYDPAGNLLSKIDAKGQKTTYEYDPAGRLTRIRYFAAGNHNTPQKTVLLSYDKAGNLVSYSDGTTSGTYSYDALNRKLSETVNYGPFSLGHAYSYYPNGLKKTFTGPDGVSYGYSYDANNQLSAVEIPAVGSITYSQYTWNRPAEVLLPGGSKRQYAYDPLMRVKEILATDQAANPMMHYQYSYDKMDNITQKGTEHGDYAYGYDPLYRLTAADNPTLPKEAYSYDGVGNRLTSAEHQNWSYNANNELYGYNGPTFQYDANGNATQKNDNGAVTNYLYNTEDRLAQVTDGAGSLTASYYYDPFGRRLWKEVAGVRTYFVYADEGLVAEADAAGTVTKTYSYRPGSTWTTDPLFMRQDGQYYFYQNDHLGTPQKMTSISGAKVWEATYKAFGEAELGPQSSVVSNLRFPGQYYDQEIDLNYNFHRNYDPKTSRYAVPDPIGVKGGINLYSYAKNNPIRFTDSLGLEALPNNDWWNISLPPIPIYGTCGSGWSEPLVPDNPFGFNFSDCCQKHDDCYGTCRSIKDQCDDNFERCMINACAGVGPGRPLRISLCHNWAKRYASAVRNLGEVAFDKAQTNCECKN